MRPRKTPCELRGPKGGDSEGGLPETASRRSDELSASKEYGTSSDVKSGVTRGMGAPRSGAPVTPVALPCLNSNNSIENEPEKGLMPTENARKRRAEMEAENSRRNGLGIKKDRDGRVALHLESEGGEVWLGGLTSSEKRNSYALGINIAHLAREYGLERLGFLTLTFRENVKDPKLGQKRWNSLASNCLRSLFTEYIKVTEVQKRGAIHYHLLVVCETDIRTGVQFEGLKKGNYSSAGKPLRSLWRQLRETMPKYGFGRSELLPIRSTVDGITGYVGKYLSKASAHRGEHMKGARLVSYSTGWRRANGRFAWVSNGALQWRQKVAKWANATGCKSFEDLKRKHGRLWENSLASTLKDLELEEVDFEEFIAMSAYVFGQE